jgi:tRNA A-37 threonylcarbamoyl transferase component Bud32
MAYAGGFSRRPSCGAKPLPKAAALPARISRTSFNSLGIVSEIRIYKKLRIDECKERLRKQRNRRRPDGEAGHINMSKTIYKHKNV